MKRKIDLIGIIIAMDKELKPFLNGKEADVTVIGNVPFYRFKIGEKDCVVVNSGIGKVNASYAATLLANEFHPDLLVSTGISGGLGRSGILELVAAKNCVQYDVDTTALGDEIGFVSTVNKTYFPADVELTDRFCNLTGAKKVTMACGDRFVADDRTRFFIINTFNAGACDMESGAIAQIAYIAKIPYVAVRCISDGAGLGAELSYEEMTDKSSAILASAVTNWIERL